MKNNLSKRNSPKTITRISLAGRVRFTSAEIPP